MNTNEFSEGQMKSVTYDRGQGQAIDGGHVREQTPLSASTH